MLKILNKEDCCGCMACYNACPAGCIKMKCDEEGFWYPEIGSDCIQCGKCEKICPMGKHYDSLYAPEVYACINKDYAIRRESSSGGIFSLMAERIIREKGVVFGAAFSENLNIYHKGIRSIEKIAELRGSKYVQSDIKETFREAKTLLDNGVMVLYSATPCQIAGLTSFLQKEYPNLITIDVICHGVPSPMVYSKFLDELNTHNPSGINKMTFRDKQYRGWKNFSIKVDFRDGTVYQGDKHGDMFLGTFLKDYFIRSSCLSCKFKCNYHGADISLGDYWGIDKDYPEFDDGKGVSLVLINTPKGKALWREIEPGFEYVMSSLEKASKHNRCVGMTAAGSPYRDEFFAYLKSHGFRDTVLHMKAYEEIKEKQSRENRKKDKQCFWDTG